jgi:hypothetical protein
MSYRAAIVSWALLASPCAALCQAYKCIVDGSTVFQQQPCAGGTKLNVAPPPEVGSREWRVTNAIAKKEVFIGMTDQEVVRSWGRPDKTNKTISRDSRSEQWIYRRDGSGNDQFLYIENGFLRSIQSPK